MASFKPKTSAKYAKGKPLNTEEKEKEKEEVSKSAFSQVGCQLIGAWVSLDPNYSSPIIASFSGMDKNTLVALCRDSLGSRCFEDVIANEHVKGKHRMTILDKLRESYSNVRPMSLAMSLAG